MRQVLILLPAGDGDDYKWFPGTQDGESSHFGGFGPDVEAQGHTWRGCSQLCVLPADATEEEQAQRLQEVLDHMAHRK